MLVAGALIGVEHEYQVFGADGRQVDFRALIHSLEWDGLRLDPGDPNAYRLRAGLVVTADGMEAETASPPVETATGFADEVVGLGGDGEAGSSSGRSVPATGWKGTPPISASPCRVDWRVSWRPFTP